MSAQNTENPRKNTVSADEHLSDSADEHLSDSIARPNKTLIDRMAYRRKIEERIEDMCIELDGMSSPDWDIQHQRKLPPRKSMY